MENSLFIKRMLHVKLIYYMYKADAAETVAVQPLLM